MRNNPGIVFVEAPHLEQPELVSGGKPRSQFLIDRVAIVTNWPDKSGKNQSKHEAFLHLLSLAKEEVAELEAWVRCLEDRATLNRIQEDLKKQHAKGTDLVTIRTSGRFLVEQHHWHRWWDEYRRSLQPPREMSSLGVCLVTGERSAIAQTHPKIMGLSAVGGNPSGSSLVSFDKDAFTSYGLSQGANAPIGERVAVAYQSALNDLIRRGMTLASIRIVYWYRNPVPDEQDLLAFLGQPNRDDQEREALKEAREQLRQLTDGARWLNSYEENDNRFYMLLLSGVAGRVMVRAWHEGAYTDLRRNVVNWFKDLEIVRADGSPAPLLGFYSILRQLVGRGEKEMPAPEVRNLWNAAVFNYAIPLAVAHRAVNQVLHSVVTGELPSLGVMAVLKGYLIRMKGADKDMESALDPNRPEVSYQLGRFLAVVDQLKAANDPNARGLLASRYFRSASTTPLVVFGRIVELSEYYLESLDSNRLKQWFRNQLTEITNRITTIPRTFSFEEQALFALGYYHQLAAFRRGNKGEGSNNDRN